MLVASTNFLFIGKHGDYIDALIKSRILYAAKTGKLLKFGTELFLKLVNTNILLYFLLFSGLFSILFITLGTIRKSNRVNA